MRVLLLSQFYDPEPNFKAHRLARSLIDRGHDVSVITGFPNYPGGKLYPGYTIRWRQREVLDGVRILRLPLYPSHSRASVPRALNYVSFAASASLLAPLLAPAADVMWVYHPPLTVGIPAIIHSLLRSVPFVFEIADMWPESVTSSGMMNSPAAAVPLHWLAALVYRRASVISVVSPGFRTNLIRKGVDAHKIRFNPNWADEEIFRPVPPDPRLAEQYGLKDRFNVVFAGNMGPAQNLEVVLEAARRLRHQPHIQWVLIGDGIDLPSLKASAAREHLDNVRFIDRQPMAAMPRFFAWADALLVQLRDDPLFRITIPSKTTAYLACGRPIICAVAGDGADVVREAGAGVICPPGDAAGLAEAVQVFYNLPARERDAMGQAGRRAFLAHYTHDVIVQQYEALFEEIVARRHAGAR